MGINGSPGAPCNSGKRQAGCLADGPGNHFLAQSEYKSHQSGFNSEEQSPYEGPQRCISLRFDTKKYAEAGNSKEAMVSLLQSGDTKRIITFAGADSESPI